MNTLYKMHKILILPNLAGEPTLVGIYSCIQKIWKLTQSHLITQPLSEGLVPLFMDLRAQGITFESLYFVRGPGSFMALKLIYLFAKTLEITQNVKLYATHAFHFNENFPIKAYGNCYFIQADSTNQSNTHESKTLDKEAKELNIHLQSFHTPPQRKPFVLPDILDLTLFNTQLKPLYLLPPI
ncbi:MULTISPECIES: hypothetical protein [Helicobacter]|nr:MULTISPECIES: hypothetical protein [Helicobacter]